MKESYQLKSDNDLKSLYPDFVFRDRQLMTNINRFSVFVCLNSLCNLYDIGEILAIVIFYLLALFSFSEFSFHQFIYCQPPINFASTKTKIINLFMLLDLCFKCISGNINFDLHYTSCQCIFRIHIYILILLLVQLISDHIE